MHIYVIYLIWERGCSVRRYIGTYRVFPEADLVTGKPVDDLYLKCKYNVQIFRYDKNWLGVLFTSGQTVNNVLPKLKKLGVNMTKVSDGDVESIYKFPEDKIDEVASILKPQVQGKNIDPMDAKNRLSKDKRITI